MPGSPLPMLERPGTLDARAEPAHSRRHGHPTAPDLWPSIDPLGEALHALRMSGVFCCRSEATAPWGVAMPPMAGCAMFHVVTEGQCWIETPDAPARCLRPGDFVLVPHGHGHRLVSEPGGNADELFALPREFTSGRYEVLRFDGGGAACGLVCGAVKFEDPAARRLIALLPPTLWIEAGEAPWMQATLQHLAAEARQMRPARRWSRGSPTS